jgi:hypothetical protein
MSCNDIYILVNKNGNCGKIVVVQMKAKMVNEFMKREDKKDAKGQSVMDFYAKSSRAF